jgi:hypothetical protein
MGIKAADFASIIVAVEFAPALPPHEVTEWSDDGDCFMFKRREDSASDKVGCAGDMVVFRNANKSAEFTLKLMQTSPTNRYLMAGLDLMENSPQFGLCSISFIDTNRQDTALGILGYVKKPPDIERGKEVKVQEWTIVVEKGALDLGDPVFAAFIAAAAAGQ